MFLASRVPPSTRSRRVSVGLGAERAGSDVDVEAGAGLAVIRVVVLEAPVGAPLAVTRIRVVGPLAVEGLRVRPTLTIVVRRTVEVNPT